LAAGGLIPAVYRTGVGPQRPLNLTVPWSMLSALAAVTTRIEFGTIVACTSFRNPALLAKMAVTLDEISGGRLILGLALQLQFSLQM
jgi:alkanesulfonate monooxygenase SsuD/methylene tetrahydromethanopterin reductase-like flavin-dependent oxidoreductase (luciferase family)